MITLTFYTTAGCHLCEQAQSLLNQLDQNKLHLNIIDIALDDELVERYGHSIPVIRFPNKQKLNWPFSKQDIETTLLQQRY